jgi:hypothetical protein
LDKRETKALIMNSEPATVETVEILKRELSKTAAEADSMRTSLSMSKKDDDYLLKEINGGKHHDAEIEELRASESLALFRSKPRLASTRTNDDARVKSSKSTRKFILISNCTSKLIIKRIKKKKKLNGSDTVKPNTHGLNLNSTSKKICFDLGQSLKELQ